MQITTIGLDIAKNVLQVHGIDAAEKVVVRKQLRRGQVMKFVDIIYEGGFRGNNKKLPNRSIAATMIGIQSS
jgi:hypothetical protein